MLAFDTLKYANTLKAAGISAEQAEAQAGALVEVLSESVVTKNDFKELKDGMTNRFDTIEKDMVHGFELVDKKFEVVDKRFGHIENCLDSMHNTIKWGAGLILSYITLVMTVMQFLKH